MNKLLILLLLNGCAYNQVDKYMEGCVKGSAITFMLIRKEPWLPEFTKHAESNCEQIRNVEWDGS